MYLDDHSINEISALLLPLMQSEKDRRSVVLLALGKHPILDQIDFSGATLTFLPTLIEKLDQFDKLNDGRPALWALLEIVREQVGLEQKQRIDALRPSFDLPPSPRLDRLFVSYSRKNERYARRLVNDLNDAGLRVWFDRDKIRAGETWKQKIEQSVLDADYFVFCLSPDSMRSENARFELLTARAHAKPIFSIMLEDCIAELKSEIFTEISWLANLHIINFSNPEAYGEKLRELILSLPGYAPPDSYVIERYDPRELVNPYRGLEAFLEVNAEFFAGREESVEHLLDRLHDPQRPRLLAVVGASGSGKSSLVRAGVIPALRRTLPFWETIIIRPGSTPLDILADRLQERLSAGAESARKRLHTNERALDDLAAELLVGSPPAARFVVVIDQFEELFTQTAEAECQHFLDLLLYAVKKPNGRVQVLLTMRSDFFDRLSSTPELARLVSDNLEVATEMTRGELERSIVEPARKAGVIFEDGLVDQILEDLRAQPGSLPLLQYALKELFERRLGRRLTNETYQALGGVKGALGEVARKLYTSFDEPQRDVLRRLLLRLVEVGDTSITRRRVERRDLSLNSISNAEIDAILTRLTDYDVRLLIASAPLPDAVSAHDADTIYEISHEALITHWDILAKWIADNRVDLQTGSDILALAKDWNATQRHDTSYLLIGIRLNTAQEWLKRNDETDLQRSFIEASTRFQHEQQQHELELRQRALNRTRLAAGVFAVFFVIAIVLLLFAREQQNQALIAADDLKTQIVVSDRRADEAHSLALAASAQDANEKNDSLALALAVEANTIPNPPPRAQSVLSRIAYEGGELITELHTTSSNTDYVSALAFSADGHYLASGGAEGTLQIWDMQTYTQLYELKGHQTFIKTLAFSPDGQHLLSGGGDFSNRNSQLRLWDLQSRTSIQLEGHNAQVTNVGFMPDGKTAYSSDLNGNIYIWSVPDGLRVRQHLVPVNSVFATLTVLSAGGSLIYQINSITARGIEWDWMIDKTMSLNLSVEEGCQAIALHPDGERLLCSSSTLADPGLYLLDAHSGAQLYRYQPVTQDIGTIAFGGDGSRFVTGESGSIQLWDTETGTLLNTWNPDPSLVATLALSPDGSRLAAEIREGSIGIWDTDLTSSAIQGEPVLRSLQLSPRTSELGSPFINALTYDTTGTTLWVGESNGARAYDVSDGKLYRQVAIDKGVASMATMSEGDLLLGSWGGVLARYHSGSNQPLWSVNAHSDALYDIAVSADQQTILTGGKDGQVLLWNAADGTLKQRLPNIPYGVYTVALSGDGKLAAAIGEVGIDSKGDSTQFELHVWDLPGGTLRYSIPTSGHSQALAASPDGSLLLLPNEDNELLLYETVTGTLLRHFIGHESTVFDIAFSSDGKQALSGGYDKTLFVWNVDTGEPLRQIDAGQGVNHVAYAPNGREFATITTDLFGGGSYDQTVWRWRLDDVLESLLLWVQNSRVGYNFTCGERARYDIAPTCDAAGFAPTQTLFPSLSPSPTLNLTQITATPSRTPTPISSITPSPTPTPTRTPIVQGELPTYGALYSVQWSPDGMRLLAGEQSGAVLVWDKASGTELHRFAGHNSTLVAGGRGRWSPDGTCIVTYSADRTARIWDAESGDLLQTLTGHTGDILSAIWSPDGTRLVSLSADNTARIWNVTTGEALIVFSQHHASIRDAEWSSDGKWIVTASDDGTTQMWDATTGAVKFVLEQRISESEQPDAVYGVSIAPDGSKLVSTGSQGSALVWDAATGKMLTNLSTAPNEDTDGANIVFDASWSPDGTQILLHNLQTPPSIWDVATGKLLYTLNGHTDLVTRAFWSVNGTQVITASLDGTIRIWDAANGRSLRTLDARASLWSAALSPDGASIAATAENGTIRLWNVRTGREQQFIFPPMRSAEPVIAVVERHSTAIADALR